jgi:hypothetical protein
VGTLCGGGRGGPPSSSPPRGFAVVPFCLGGSWPFVLGLPSVGLLVAGGGEDVKSRSMSMGVGWSLMADIADKRRSSSGGRLSGCESLSYFCVLDREKVFLVGDEDLEEDWVERRVRSANGLPRDSLPAAAAAAFFFFLLVSEAGESGALGVFSGVSGSAAFFLDLKRFI